MLVWEAQAAWELQSLNICCFFLLCSSLSSFFLSLQETWLEAPLWLPTPRLLECCRDDCMPRGAFSRQVEPLAVTPGGPTSAQAEPGHVLLSVGMGGPGTIGASWSIRFLVLFFVFFDRNTYQHLYHHKDEDRAARCQINVTSYIDSDHYFTLSKLFICSVQWWKKYSDALHQ